MTLTFLSEVNRGTIQIAAAAPEAFMSRGLFLPFLILSALAALALPNAIRAQDGLAARLELNQGVQAFKNAQYAKAVEHFQAAVRLDPSFLNARLYLASAYMSQYIPGDETPENVRMALAAEDEFRKVLMWDPENQLAAESLGSLSLKQKKFDEAQKWYEKLIAINPQKKEAYYNLGVLAWTRTYKALAEARAKLGMLPADPGPLRDENLRKELAVTYTPIINYGFENLGKALDLDPDYDDAMGYLSLLYRSKADLEDSLDASQNDTRLADQWMKKTLDAKKRKAQPRPSHLPPPPPPPPPPRQ